MDVLCGCICQLVKTISEQKLASFSLVNFPVCCLVFEFCCRDKKDVYNDENFTCFSRYKAKRWFYCQGWNKLQTKKGLKCVFCYLKVSLGWVRLDKFKLV